MKTTWLSQVLEHHIFVPPNPPDDGDESEDQDRWQYCQQLYEHNSQHARVGDYVILTADTIDTAWYDGRIAIIVWIDERDRVGTGCYRVRLWEGDPALCSWREVYVGNFSFIIIKPIKEGQVSFPAMPKGCADCGTLYNVELVTEGRRRDEYLCGPHRRGMATGNGYEEEEPQSIRALEADPLENAAPFSTATFLMEHGDKEGCGNCGRDAHMGECLTPEIADLDEHLHALMDELGLYKHPSITKMWYESRPLYCAVIQFKTPEGRDGETWWGMANETWDAGIYYDGKVDQDPAGIVATNVSSEERNIQDVANAIIESMKAEGLIDKGVTRNDD